MTVDGRIIPLSDYAYDEFERKMFDAGFGWLIFIGDPPHIELGNWLVVRESNPGPDYGQTPRAH